MPTARRERRGEMKCASQATMQSVACVAVVDWYPTWSVTSTSMGPVYEDRVSQPDTIVSDVWLDPCGDRTGRKNDLRFRPGGRRRARPGRGPRRPACPDRAGL